MFMRFHKHGTVPSPFTSTLKPSRLWHRRRQAHHGGGGGGGQFDSSDSGRDEEQRHSSSVARLRSRERATPDT